MNKTLSVLILALVMVGCKGKEGPKGPQGVAGPGRFETLTGAVPSNFFTVTDSSIGQASLVTVYISGAGEIAELPYFLPASGVNTYAIGRLNANAVDIYNAQLAGATQYIISIIIE